MRLQLFRLAARMLSKFLTNATAAFPFGSECSEKFWTTAARGPGEARGPQSNSKTCAAEHPAIGSPIVGCSAGFRLAANAQKISGPLLHYTTTLHGRVVELPPCYRGTPNECIRSFSA